MNIKSLTTKIVGYDPATQHMQVVVKSDLCQRHILDYDPINVDLAQASVPYDIEAALKGVATSAYYMIKSRLLKESKTPEFFEQLAQQVDTAMQHDQTFTLGVDIPALESALVNESSSQGNEETPVQTV